jgi:hypothetical protein
MGPLAWLHVWHKHGLAASCDSQRKHAAVKVDDLEVDEWLRAFGPAFIRDSKLDLDAYDDDK